MVELKQKLSQVKQANQQKEAAIQDLLNKKKELDD